MDAERVQTRRVDEVELGHVQILRQSGHQDGDHQLAALHFEVRLVGHLQLASLESERGGEEGTRRSTSLNTTERRQYTATKVSRIIAFSLLYIDSRLRYIICPSPAHRTPTG